METNTHIKRFKSQNASHAYARDRSHPQKQGSGSTLSEAEKIWKKDTEPVGEKVLERLLREEVKKLGGLALKFTSPGSNGVPDRVVLMPGGKTYFVELKSTGKKPTAQQRVTHKNFAALGHDVFVVSTRGELKTVLAVFETEAR